MNEKAARTRWCPKLQITYSGGFYISNRGERSVNFENINTACIASECNWWVEDLMYIDGNLDNDMVVVGGHCGAIK